MKKIVTVIAIIFTGLNINAQNNLPDSIDLNLLNAPANPAFNLLGISPTSVERPTDLSSFRLSIQNATNSFTKFPSNYAVELSPASIFDKRSQTLRQFNSTKFQDVLWQTFSLSIAMTKTNKDDKETNDSSSTTKVGFGFKLSLIRPAWNQTTLQKVDSFYLLMKTTDAEFEKIATPLFNKNARLKKIENEMATLPEPIDMEKLNLLLNKQKLLRDSIILQLKDSLKGKVFSDASNSLKQYAKGLKIERKGLFLDFATGMVLDFAQDKFNNSSIAKAGAWLTGGYEGGNKGLSVLAIARYLYQPDKIFADDSGKIKSKNISTFDGGARLIFSALEGKFSASAEAIYRSILNDNVIKPSWRFTFNAEYSVAANQKLTLSIGRNFDGTISKDGNLIAALNFIRGFGNNKKVGN